jgi:hypothetical protein
MCVQEVHMPKSIMLFSGLVLPCVLLFSCGTFLEVPIVLGPEDADTEIAMVYHPGATSLTGTINRLVAEKLASRGYRVTLYTTGEDLSIDTTKVTIMGFSSPVYGSTLQAPLSDFIKRTDLTGMKCFFIITGIIQSLESRDLEWAKEKVEAQGGTFIGGKKFCFVPNDADITALVDALTAAF